MKVFGFIPARYASQRFPGKPLAVIEGKPMIQHVYECAISCPEFSEVWVATDDERISDVVSGFGGRAVMTDHSHRSGTDRIREAAIKVGLEKEDIVVNIQGDQPKFSPSIITLLIRPFLEDLNIQMTTLKYKLTDERDIQNPNHVKVVTDRHGYAMYFSRSAIPYFRDMNSTRICYKHLGLYGFRMEFLSLYTQLSEGELENAEKLEQLRVLEHGIKIKVLESPFDSIEVDVPEDILKIEGRMA
ncbi:MAG: 3-deoxy-manno-octulosonate cytidylyltransferase [Deltaproteobacteria bacterium]|nr:3-deoxy-manno-octulosonate cytidylyltransferase [Deltaproteobacteria bacterium]